MKLLNRIACSQGNPQRARTARDLVIRQRLHAVGQPSSHPRVGYFFIYLNQSDYIDAGIEIRRSLMRDEHGSLH